jgi:threonine dehydrogenase-like Zn-dependent dehydrogenase
VSQPTIVFSTSRPGTLVRNEPGWSHGRLLATARELLGSGRIAAEELIGAALPLERAAEAYRLIDEEPSSVICAVLDYESPSD